MKLNLITLKAAKHHVNVDHDSDDAQLERMRFQASATVLNYIKKNVLDTSFDWCDLFGEPTQYVPGHVEAATLLILGGLYENRDGDVWRTAQPLSQAAMDLLWRERDPAFA
jgi:hypothetical protein